MPLMMNTWVKITATFGYLGLSPWAPGTVGTLGAIPLAALLMWRTPPEFYIGFSFVFAIVSTFIAQAYEDRVIKHDSREIVIDEVAGYLVAMTLLPFTWQSFLLGFLVFRFFDIIKPFPIRLLDRKVKGGVGVVIDDIVAGLFTNVVLQGVFFLAPWVLGATH